MADAEPITAWQMGRVLDAARALAVVLELDKLLPQLARATCDVLGCDRASVWLHDPDRRLLHTRVALGADPIVVPDTAGVVGAALAANAVLNIPRPYDDPRFDTTTDRRTGYVTRSLLAAPLVDLAGRAVGVVQAVNKLGGGPFTASDESLARLLADQAAVAVQRQALHDAAARAVALDREMALARDVQRALIPAAAPATAGLRVDGWTRPASAAGGDCYDLWPLPDGRLAALVADASGHGLGPAMIVSQVRTMARLLCESADGPCTVTDPADVLHRINRRLTLDLDPSQFVTAVLAFADGDGTVTYASAGHGPSLLRPGPGRTVESLDSTGLPLGIADDWLAAADDPPSRTVTLDPGGSLLLMSDGVFEAFDPHGRQFDVTRTSAAFDGPDAATAATVVAAVRLALDDWLAAGPQLDDQTLVAIRRDG